MFGLFALIGFLVAGFFVAATFGLIFLVLKVAFWAVLLPFRLLFKILMIPVWFTLGALGLLAGVAMVPILLVVLAGVAIFGLLAAAFALLLPAIPFVLFGLMLWAIFRKRPVPA